MAKLKAPGSSSNEDPGPEDKLVWQPPTLDTWLDSVDEEENWLVEHFVPADAIILLSGQQKRAFKTWNAFLLAASIASGKSVAGLNVVRSGPVLIIEEEGAKPETKGRWNRLKAGHDFGKLDNLYFAHRQRIKLDDKAWLAKLQSWLQAIKPILVVYDGLTFAHSGDENSHEDMSKVVDSLQMIRNTGASVIMLAHLDKARGENPKADIDTQVRGSSLIVNMYDVHIAARRYKASQAYIDTIVRARDHGEKRFSITWDVPEDKDYAKASILQIIEGEKPVENAVERCRSLLKPGSYTARGLRELWGVSEKTARTIRERLIEDGVIVAQGNAFKVMINRSSEV